jgi:mono/diheme cytochrome c family protein
MYDELERTPPTPQEVVARSLSRRRRAVAAAVLLAAGAGALVFYACNADRPARYDDVLEHFKYGSIGSDRTPNGLPLEILAALPELFPHHLPEGAPHDYTAFGFIAEEGRRLPIGFSERRALVVDLTGINCAACHVTTVRERAEAPPRVYLGAPAATVDLVGFFRFLFDCAADQRFTPEDIMPGIEARRRLGWLERRVLRDAVVEMRMGLLGQRDRLHPIFASGPGATEDPGPGRVDTFNPYKLNVYHFPQDALTADELVGEADFPSLWNQRSREGLHLHWDGNNTVVHERNLSAAFGAEATPAGVDLEGIARVERWIWDLAPPPYPFAIDRALAAEGARTYREQCYGCHADRDFGEGSTARRETGVGQVEPLQRIATDPYRLWSFTHALAVHQGTLLGNGREDQRLAHFRVTGGYANVPLDGIWLRAPYLHNGSVPTLRDLLLPARERPAAFYRGYDVYDPEAVGFVSTVAREGSRRFSLFRTRDDRSGEPLPGNSNEGHEYGTDLAEAQKRALLEYLKTL